jgi:hypothetical protein
VRVQSISLASALLTSSPRPIDWPKLTAEFEKQMFARAKEAVKASEDAAKRA